MPIIALVLMGIGSIGILIGIATLIWFLVSSAHINFYHNPDPLTLIFGMFGSFMVGQMFFNAGLFYWIATLAE